MSLIEEDEIVISGIGGHYPSSDSPKELMENLFKGMDMTTSEHNKWPPAAAQGPNTIGNIKDNSKCDAQFFGIMRKNCNSMDPVTRKILERTLEAIIDAGISPQDLKGSNTGVFISCAILETEMFLMQSGDQEHYGVMGRNRALNANRLSYWLDLKGPSYSTDSMFNGGIQALQEACTAIKLGTIDAAIVGSGSLILHPDTGYQFEKLNLLSPDGKTRCFDAEANGYGRAETVSILILQKAKDAKRSHGSIIHVLNQSMCEKPALLQEPLKENWEFLYETFYDQCKIDPSQVAYLEANGMANPRTDADELNAAGEFFCKNRSLEKPLLVGSVKSNLGHSEGGANMCAIAKLVIAMENDKIPGNLHFKTPNPKIKDLIRGTMKVVSETMPLTGEFLAMNSFGLGSTYGHVLLRRNPRQKVIEKPEEGSLPHIVLASARHEDGMNIVLDALEQTPFDPEYVNLVNNAFRNELTSHMYRGYTTLPGQAETPIRGSQHYSGGQRPVWFVFAGMGSQWPAMARDLLAIKPFKKSMDKSAEILKNYGLDLHYIVTNDDPTILDNILHNFVSIVAVQIALVDVLRELKIKPDGIIGHSVGETSASYCDGCLNQEQTLLSAYYRGRASLEATVIKGTMAAVGIGYQQMKDRVPAGIEIGCHNGPDSCTLSGPTEQVQEFVKQLTSEGIFARAVNVANIPYHSSYINDMGPRMFDYLRDVIPEGKKRSPTWISTSVPESRWGEPASIYCNASYLINNLLSPVLFEEGSRHIPSDAITIEIAPHGLLQAILKRSLPTCTNITLTNRNAKNQQHVFLNAIGKMYVNGMSPRVEKLYEPITYPVSRGTGFLSHLVTWDHSDTWSCNTGVIQDASDRSKTVELQIDHAGSYLNAHRLEEKRALPYSVYLTEIMKVYAASQKLENCKTLTIELKDVIFHKELITEGLRDVNLYILLQPGSGSFEILHTGTDLEDLIMTGIIKETEPTYIEDYKDETKNTQQMTTEEVYTELANRGHQNSKELQVITSLVTGEKVWKASLKNDGINKIIEALLQLKTLETSRESAKIHKIVKIRKIVIDGPRLTNVNDEVTADLDIQTGLVRCGGISIRGVTFDSYQRSPVKFTNDELNANKIQLPTSNGPIKISLIQFSGTELRGKQVAYSGTEGSQKKLMGFGATDDNAINITTDNILKWIAPTKWTMEESASVARNYGLAYYAVHAVAQLEAGMTVAITDATNKLGLACVKVAFAKTTSVIAIVNTPEEKSELLKLVPKINAENILINAKRTNEQLCLVLRKRCPKGVNIAINTGSPELAHIIIQCMRPFSSIIEMSDDLFETKGKLRNTFGFLISASLYNCSGKDLINSSDRIKQEIQKLVADGITSGLVAPLIGATIREWRQTTTLKLDANQRTKRFQCNAEKGNLILGGEPYSWIAMVEWLIQRNAKNIIVVHKAADLSNTLKFKLEQLKGKCNLVIKTADSLSDKLIDHIFEVSRSKIDLTILMPLQENQDCDKTVMSALYKQDCSVLSIQSSQCNVKEIAENQKRAKPWISVLWKDLLNGNTSRFLESFDQLLQLEHNQVIQVEEDNSNQIRLDDIQEILLPNSLEEVLQFKNAIPTEVELVELHTKSIGYAKCKEAPTLYVIPGLRNRDQLIAKFRESMYPVFVVNLPTLTTRPNTTMEEYASAIVPKLKTLGKGPYSLLGEGWGGAVALETARLLEKTGDETQVFLVEASPQELKNPWTTPEDLDIALLNRIFKIDTQILEKKSTWEEKLNVCLALTKPDQEKEVALCLTSIRQKASSLLGPSNKEPINGFILCVSRQNMPRSDLGWMSRQDIPLTKVKADQPILNDDVFELLHNKIAVRQLPKN